MMMIVLLLIVVDDFWNFSGFCIKIDEADVEDDKKEERRR
jgi:hypothetical protein